MTFLTKRHLPRRTFLRGLGVTMSLPLLDSMIPAQTPLAKTAANPQIRLGLCFIPHGGVMANWTPAEEGALKLSRTLAPLEPFKDQVVVVSNLAHKMAAPAGPGDNGGDHTRSPAVFLNGVHPKRTDGADIYAGVTIDQIAAQKIGQETALPSLELATEDMTGLIGACDVGFSCTYTNTISWKTPTTPLPMENNPQVVFEKLFGDGSNNADRLARKQQSRSLLDSVMDQVASLQRELPTSDRTRLGEYLDDVREIERRIQKAENQIPADLKLPEAPVGVPESFDEHFKIMYDLQVLAFRAEITRVATLMYARDTSGAVYPQSGIRDGFHVASHHSNNRVNMDKFALINKYHVEMLAYFLDKLKSTPDGDGNLLDHSMVLYGSSMSNGNQHDHDPLPIVLAGGASGQLNGGRHMTYAPHTPMSNLLLSMLDKLGIQADKHGDSTGKLEI